jgi:hypothetical protein
MSGGRGVHVSNPYRDRLLGVGFISGRFSATVHEDRAPDGQRRKHTTDELGNTVTEWARGDRQDVLVRAPEVKLTTTTEERRA